MKAQKGQCLVQHKIAGAISGGISSNPDRLIGAACERPDHAEMMGY